MMQKSIASDEAEMRYVLQTILSICSKYILYSLILTIPCSVLCNTQDTHRSRVHCTTSKVYLHTQEWCTLHHFQNIRAQTRAIYSKLSHRSRVHCTTYKVYVNSVHSALHTQQPCTLHHFQSIRAHTGAVTEAGWHCYTDLSRWVELACRGGC